MKRTLLFLLLFLPLCVLAQHEEKELISEVIQAWNDYQIPKNKIIESILARRDALEKHIKIRNRRAKMALLENRGIALHKIAVSCKNREIEKIKPALLKKAIAGIDLESEEIVKSPRISFIVHDYFALKAIRDGAPIDQAWGGMWFNTSIQTVGNEYDYQRYRQVLKLNNPKLILSYLSCLKDVFRFNGYTNGLDELRPDLEKYMPEGELKQEILELYDYYGHLKEGMLAPMFYLKDFKGKEHSLADYKGKVVVIDVWATWCGGCIANLPKFMTIREKYKGRKDIEFITISIDGERAFNSWKYALPRLKLMEVTNLFAPKETSDFQEKYNITGIPRYMIIDRQGKIVTVYAPSPGMDFERWIEKALVK